jgi:hypothetical protein
MTEKELAIRDLERARLALRRELQRSNPKAWVAQSLREHPGVWAALGGSAGLLLSRLLKAPEAANLSRDKAVPSGQKKGLFALLMGPAFHALRREALAQGASLLAQWAAQRAQRGAAKSSPQDRTTSSVSPPNDPSNPHV